MVAEPGWELYRSFLAVLRGGSLSDAARRLALTQPTIGRHIASLESALNLSLFTRYQRGLRPTQAAMELVPHAEAMEAAAASLIRAASGGGGEQGTIRIAASEIVGCEVLPPMLAKFRRQHPAITLELVLSNRNENLLRRDADIAIRMARPTQKALRAKFIGKVSLGLYAHESYIAAFGRPGSLAELAEHCLIGFDQDSHSFRSAGPLAASLSRDQFGFRCDSDPVQLAALRAGMGIGGCQTRLAMRDPALIRVLPEVTLGLEMWLAMHEDLKASTRVRLLFGHLAAMLAQYAERN